MTLTCQGDNPDCSEIGPLECLFNAKNGCKLQCEKVECPPKITVNKTILIIYLSIITVLSLILTIIISFTLRKHNTLQFFMFSTLLLITIWVNTVIINSNPFCLFKPCLTNSDNWGQIKGVYTGSKEYLGVNINITVEFLSDNKVKILKLSCDRKICPTDNLLSYCKDTVVTISDQKTNFGYVITGPCITSIKENTKNLVSNVWAVRKNNDIFMQLLITIKKVKINILVPLKPQ